MRRKLHCWLIFLLLAGCAGPGYFEAVPPSSAEKSVVYLYRPEADNPGRQPLRFSYPDVLVDEQSVGFWNSIAIGVSSCSLVVIACALPG